MCPAPATSSGAMGGRPQDQPQGQGRPLRAGVEEVARDRQFGRDHQALPGPVLMHLVAQQQPLAALGHDDQQRLGQRVVQRVGLDPGQPQPVDRRVPVRAGVSADEVPDLGQQRSRVTHRTTQPFIKIFNKVNPV